VTRHAALYRRRWWWHTIHATYRGRRRVRALRCAVTVLIITVGVAVCVIVLTIIAELRARLITKAREADACITLSAGSRRDRVNALRATEVELITLERDATVFVVLTPLRRRRRLCASRRRDVNHHVGNRRATSWRSWRTWWSGRRCCACHDGVGGRIITADHREGA
jgi:hypothetical protein